MHLSKRISKNYLNSKDKFWHGEAKRCHAAVTICMECGRYFGGVVVGYDSDVGVTYTLCDVCRREEGVS